MPVYTVLVEVKILAQVKLNIGTGQSSYSAWTVADREMYLS